MKIDNQLGHVEPLEVTLRVTKGDVGRIDFANKLNRAADAAGVLEARVAELEFR